MRKKLGEILIEQGSVKSADVDAAIEVQSGGDPARIGDLLLSAGKVTPLQLARALCAQSGLPFVQLDQVSPEVAGLVPIGLQREHCLVPFKEDGKGKAIHVAVADPTTRDVLAELEFQVGRELKISIAARDEIESVHAALQGDLLEASIVVEDEAPAPAPAPAAAARAPLAAQPLGRVALKRVQVSADGVMTDAPPRANGAPAEAPKAPLAGNNNPTVEMPMVAPAAMAAAKQPPAASPVRPLPPRATGRQAKPPASSPPVLKPVEAPAPTAPARPKNKPTGAVTRKAEVPSKPGAPPDEWAVRPVAAAIPKASAPPAASPAPPGLDPFATLPTELVGGPRDYVPASAELPALSALEADPQLREALDGPELALGRGIPSPTMVEFYVAPPPPIAASKIAIEPAPLALSPPRRKAPKAGNGPVPDASLFAGPAATALEFKSAALVPPPPAELVHSEVTVQAPALARPPIDEPVPSGRERPLETEHEARPAGAHAGATEAFPAFVPSGPPERTVSLEFIPPAETNPRARVATPPRGEPAQRPPLDEGVPATPPGGEPIVTEQVERPIDDDGPAATPPKPSPAPAVEENLVSGTVDLPASLAPPADDAAPAGEAMLTAAPLEEPPPPSTSAPAVPAAPVELAVSPLPSPPGVDLPAWMRENAPPPPGVDDPLVAAVVAPGATTALVRVLRLLVKRGLLTEAELLEELKKG